MNDPPSKQHVTPYNSSSIAENAQNKENLEFATENTIITNLC